MSMTITDAWFDGDHPNPLHPRGVIVEPVNRVAIFTTVNGSEILSVGDSIDLFGRVRRAVPEPTNLEVWRD